MPTVALGLCTTCAACGTSLTQLKLPDRGLLQDLSQLRMRTVSVILEHVLGGSVDDSLMHGY
jgi:hypothetical protein